MTPLSVLVSSFESFFEWGISPVKSFRRWRYLLGGLAQHVMHVQCSCIAQLKHAWQDPCKRHGGMESRAIHQQALACSCSPVRDATRGEDENLLLVLEPLL